MAGCLLSSTLLIESETTMSQNHIHIEIIVKETLSGRWALWFEESNLEELECGSTRISGDIPDQSSLHGLLERIRDLNLNLVSVQVHTIDSAE
jgi:hypothetical protein